MWMWLAKRDPAIDQSSGNFSGMFLHTQGPKQINQNMGNPIASSYSAGKGLLNCLSITHQVNYQDSFVHPTTTEQQYSISWHNIHNRRLVARLNFSLIQLPMFSSISKMKHFVHTTASSPPTVADHSVFLTSDLRPNCTQTESRWFFAMRDQQILWEITCEKPLPTDKEIKLCPILQWNFYILQSLLAWTSFVQINVNNPVFQVRWSNLIMQASQSLFIGHNLF